MIDRLIRLVLLSLEFQLNLMKVKIQHVLKSINNVVHEISFPMLKVDWCWMVSVLFEYFYVSSMDKIWSSTNLNKRFEQKLNRRCTKPVDHDGLVVWWKLGDEELDFDESSDDLVWSRRRNATEKSFFLKFSIWIQSMSNCDLWKMRNSNFHRTNKRKNESKCRLKRVDYWPMTNRDFSLIGKSLMTNEWKNSFLSAIEEIFISFEINRWDITTVTFPLHYPNCTGKYTYLFIASLQTRPYWLIYVSMRVYVSID